MRETFRSSALEKLRKPSTYLRLASMAAAIGLGVYTDNSYLKSDYYWAGLVGGFIVGDVIDSFILKPSLNLYNEWARK